MLYNEKLVNSLGEILWFFRHIIVQTFVGGEFEDDIHDKERIYNGFKAAIQKKFNTNKHQNKYRP